MHASTFDYLKPTEKQIATMAEVRKAYTELLELLERSMPDSRYRSLAVTHLETSAMFAMKGITRDSDGTPRD